MPKHYKKNRWEKGKGVCEMKDVILWGIALFGWWAYLCPLVEPKCARLLVASVVGATLGYGFGNALMGVILK